MAEQDGTKTVDLHGQLLQHASEEVLAVGPQLPGHPVDVGQYCHCSRHRPCHLTVMPYDAIGSDDEDEAFDAQALPGPEGLALVTS
ncbi:hypothetical protein [Streptomyces tendae]|uniref:hypothetical protein n=1 Tax=Streptomyces tendae TaxID=1932 RepID=UPI0037A8F429